MTIEAQFWHDNPAEHDLLGFGPIIESVVEALSDPQLSPLTVGIHAPWGSGKTTILGMVEEAVAQKHGEAYVIVRTSPWEYDDHTDAKGELIGEVLAALQEGREEAIGDRVRALLGRIAWSRVARVVAKGALTMTLDIDGMVDALTPADRTKEERTMRGFRAEFERLLEDIGVERVVVLVDDLDRCLPPAVMATFEAIKLFLSVRGMSFVLAADNDMVQDAIAAGLGESRRSERFARRYLEKIVQMPVSLPRLSVHEAEAYIALLLASHAHDEQALQQLVDHCDARRVQQTTPFVGDFGDRTIAPTQDHLRLASQVAHGLRADKHGNPRDIKRFLNAFAVREHIARRRDVNLSTAIMAKLFLLENQFPTVFERLAAATERERATLIERWENSASDDDAGDPPEGLPVDARAWAAAEPSLEGMDLSRYVTVAAALATRHTAVGGSLDDELRELVDELLSTSKVARKRAQVKLAGMDQDEIRRVAEELLALARRTDKPGEVIRALIHVGDQNDERFEFVAEGIRESCWTKITTQEAYLLARVKTPALKSLALDFAADPNVDAKAREYLNDQLRKGTQGGNV